MLNLNEIAKESLAVAVERFNKNEIADPRVLLNTLKHCATEVVEALNASDLLMYSNNYAHKTNFAVELADIIMCALTASAVADIDIEKAINTALMKNKTRYMGAVK